GSEGAAADRLAHSAAGRASELARSLGAAVIWNDIAVAVYGSSRLVSGALRWRSSSLLCCWCCCLCFESFTMPKTLNGEIKRVSYIATTDQIRQVEQWRRKQPFPMPNVSEAIRRLVDLGLGAKNSTRKARRAAQRGLGHG